MNGNETAGPAQPPVLVVIPSLEPDRGLLGYVRQLREAGLTRVILVDDGSGKDYRLIFDELEGMGCTVLHHPENLGKGAALKTAFGYIRQQVPHCSAVVTVDADGQHGVPDVVTVAQLAQQHPESLVLGVRDFSAPGVPAKSLAGNRTASLVFRLLYGRRLEDTQTGLRGFGQPLLDTMLAVGGSRFEYEIQMLITCVRQGIPMETTPIQVIYEDNNRGTHYRPFRDSLWIVGTLLRGFLQFSAASLAGAAVDLGVAWLLMDLLRPWLPDYQRIFAATLAARLVSVGVNYLLGRHLVFRERGSGYGSLVRYLTLAGLLMLSSATGVWGLHRLLGVPEKTAKLVCDTLLFFISYPVQRRWVFGRSGG